MRHPHEMAGGGWRDLGEVARAVAVVVLLANLGAAALLAIARPTGLDRFLRLDLRPAVEIRIDADRARLEAIAAALDPELGATVVGDGAASAVLVRADDSAGALAAVRAAAAACGLEVGFFVLLNPFAAVLDGVLRDDAGAAGLLALLALPTPFAFLWVGRRGRRRLEPRAPSPTPTDRAVREGLGLGLLAVLLGLLLDRGLSSLGHEQPEQPLVFALLESGGPALAGLFVLAVLAAPLGEELFFRGYVLDRLQRTRRPGTAMLASSVLFALLHLNPSALPHYTLLGLLLAWSYRRTAGLVAPTVGHALHNALVLSFAVWAATPAAAADEEPTRRERTARPNLVVFLVDDLGWQDTSVQLGPTPSPWQAHWRTPNVERLAAEGLAFTDAYASAAVCSPSRIALLTGQAPARHGSTYWILHAGRDTSAAHPRLAPPEWDTVGLEPGDVNLAALLRAAGYRTIHVGKAHLGALGSPGSDPTALGFDVNVAGHGAGAPGSYSGVDGFGWTKTPDSVWNVPGLEAFHGQEVWLTDVLAQRAVEELERAHAEAEPFLLHFAPYAVHTPIMADPARVAAYAGLPAVEAAYATLIEGVDAALGRVLDTLDRLGIADQTLVVFASDNGGLAAHTRAGEPHRQNGPLRSGKGSAYEGGVRIPLVVRGPGVADRGARSAEPIVLHDLFPTLCAAAGVEPPADHALDGRDLGPLLAGAADGLGDRSLLWHQPHFWGVAGPGIEPYSALRRGPEKLIWFHDGGRLELYDLVADPGETRDLAAERPDRVAALTAELVERLRAVGARPSIDRASGAPVPWPGG